MILGECHTTDRVHCFLSWWLCLHLRGDGLCTSQQAVQWQSGLFVLCRLADELLSIEAESSTNSSSATQVEQSGNSDLSRKWTLISPLI
jgi:hypothetical protein